MAQGDCFTIMSGHNKWSKIKDQKLVMDKKKGQLYTYFARKITAAVREGKGVSQVIDQAKAESVPKHVIDRAVAKANHQSQNLQSVIFEGFLNNGKIHFVIFAETDNNFRTSNQVKNVFDKHGGKMGSPGSVMYLFTQAGRLYVPNSPQNIDLILESGANDFFEEDDEIRIETEVADLHKINVFFKDKGVNVLSSEIVYEAQDLINLTDEEKVKYDNFIASLNLIEDVMGIYSNAEN